MILPEFKSAQLSEALEHCQQLLSQGSCNDMMYGPRWRGQSLTELRKHLDYHVASTRHQNECVDPDSGCYEMAHVAVRALMLLQLAIESDRARHARAPQRPASLDRPDALY